MDAFKYKNINAQNAMMIFYSIEREDTITKENKSDWVK